MFHNKKDLVLPSTADEKVYKSDRRAIFATGTALSVKLPTFRIRSGDRVRFREGLGL